MNSDDDPDPACRLVHAPKFHHTSNLFHDSEVPGLFLAKMLLLPGTLKSEQADDVRTSGLGLGIVDRAPAAGRERSFLRVRLLFRLLL